MAATEVSLLFTKRGGRDTWDKHRTYTREYEVLTDDPADDEQVAGAAAGLPRLGDPLDSDADAVAVSVDCQQSDDSPMIWYVTVEYDTDPPQSSAANRPEQRVDFDGNEISKDRPTNPLLEPATWTLGFQDTEEPVSEWTEVNAAGELELPVAPQWVGSTPYPCGSYVRNGGNVYFQSAPGTGVSGSGAGPVGVGTAIADGPAAWAAVTAYNPGDYRTNGGNVYRCTQGGTSAGAGGPSGEGAEITDGTVIWTFAGVPAVWSFYATFAQTLDDPQFAILEAVLNSAGFPFDPPAMTTVSRPVLTVTKNVPVTSLEYLMALRNAWNVDTWRGVPPRCAKIASVEHDGGKQTNGIPYVTGKFVIHLDPDTFDLRILDAGFGKLQTAPGGLTKVFVRFKDRNGDPMDEPTLLNGAGGALRPGDPPVFKRGVPRQVQLIDFNTMLPF